MLFSLGCRSVGHFVGHFFVKSANTKKKGFSLSAETLDITGRGGGIRTHDPLHPMQVRYQAALRPDKHQIITENPMNQRRNISITYCNSARRLPVDRAWPVGSTPPCEFRGGATTPLASPSSSRLRAPLIVKPWL